MREVVKTLAREAIRRKGTAAALSQALFEEGIVGEGGKRYAHQTVSNWARGTARPPADVLLGVALLTGLSVDELIHGQSMDNRLTQLEATAQRQGEALQRIERLLERMRVQEIAG